MRSVATQSTILDILTGLAILVRLAVIVRCFALGQIRRYLFFCVMLVFTIVVSSISILAHGVYSELWKASRWEEAAVNACAAVEAFWGLARHYRNIRGFGWKLISLIVVISSAASGIIGLIRAEWTGPLRVGLLIGEFVNIALALTALLSTAFFRQFRNIPVRPNARLHLRILGVIYAVNATANFLSQITGIAAPFALGLLFRLSPISGYTWWLFAMRSSGDALPFPHPEMSDEEYKAAEAGHKRQSDQIKQASSEALEKTFDSSKKPKRD